MSWVSSWWHKNTSPTFECQGASFYDSAKSFECHGFVRPWYTLWCLSHCFVFKTHASLHVSVESQSTNLYAYQTFRMCCLLLFIVYWRVQYVDMSDPWPVWSWFELFESRRCPLRLFETIRAEGGRSGWKFLHRQENMVTMLEIVYQFEHRLRCQQVVDSRSTQNSAGLGPDDQRAVFWSEFSTLSRLLESCAHSKNLFLKHRFVPHLMVAILYRIWCMLLPKFVSQ